MVHEWIAREMIVERHRDLAALTATARSGSRREAASAALSQVSRNSVSRQAARWSRSTLALRLEVSAWSR
jgi:hypothetical protein